jgi:protein SCO1/2
MKSFTKSVLTFGIMLGILLTGCSSDALRGGTLEPPRAAPNLRLPDQYGRIFDLEEHRGKVVLVFFGYTYCPDVCPVTLAQTASVLRKLASQAKQVQVVFVTVDPQRDTPEVLANYLKNFDPTFIGLSASPIATRQVLNAYEIKAVRRDSTNSTTYTIDHTSLIYVIDKQGLLREVINFGVPSDDVLHDLKFLLR